MQAVDVAKVWFEAEKNRDLARMSELYHEDCLVHADGMKARGKAAIIEALALQFSLESEVTRENVRMFGDGGIAAIEWSQPDSRWPDYVVRSCIVFEVRDGKIAVQRYYATDDPDPPEEGTSLLREMVTFVPPWERRKA